VNTGNADPQDTIVVARSLTMLGQLADAQAVLVAGLRLARDLPEQLLVMAQELGSLFERTRDTSAALSCAWHSLDLERMNAIEVRVPPRDRARSWVLRARGVANEDDRARCLVKAATLFAQERRWVHAADLWGQAGELQRALEGWQSAARAVGRFPYALALCRVNEARTAQRLARMGVANAAFERAVELLRATAAHHARNGQPDIAADCHGLVVEVAEAWERPSLADEARRDCERELERDLGVLQSESVGTRAATVTRELLAWENAWDITEVTADWMTSSRSDVAPALAFELRLLALEIEGKPSGAVVYALSRLAHGLGDAGYEALGPLEVLSRRRSSAVRIAVARSLGRLPCRRSLRALTRALDDTDPAVVKEAQKSIAAMRGPKVLGGVLTLIGTGTYGRGFRRDASMDATRRAAFSALAGTEEAAQLVSWILEHGGQSDRRLMGEVLGAGEG